MKRRSGQVGKAAAPSPAVEPPPGFGLFDKPLADVDAEACFDRAIATARRLGQKHTELAVAVARYEFLAQRGRATTARAALERAVADLSDRAPSTELKAARKLLRQS